MLAQGKTPNQRPLSFFDQHVLDFPCWFHASPGRRFTVREVADIARDLRDGTAKREDVPPDVLSHCDRILSCDLSIPIIIAHDMRPFRLVDGCHRIARAWVERLSHISVIEYDRLPPPHKTESLDAGAPK